MASVRHLLSAQLSRCPRLKPNSLLTPQPRGRPSPAVRSFSAGAPTLCYPSELSTKIRPTRCCSVPLPNYATTTTTTTTTTTGSRSFSSSPSILPSDDDIPLEALVKNMTDEELQDNSTIPGWELIHNPPRKFPRGAFVGVVVSDKMQKTVNVQVTRYRLVPKIRKRVKYTRKFMAHDENEVANMGDTVLIVPCQKISKNKHFMLREIIRPKGQLY